MDIDSKAKMFDLLSAIYTNIRWLLETRLNRIVIDAWRHEIWTFKFPAFRKTTSALVSTALYYDTQHLRNRLLVETASNYLFKTRDDSTFSHGCSFTPPPITGIEAKRELDGHVTHLVITFFPEVFVSQVLSNVNHDGYYENNQNSLNRINDDVTNHSLC